VSLHLNSAERAYLFALFLAVMVLAGLHALVGLWAPALLTLLLGTAGLAAHWRWRWLSSLAFVGLAGVAVNGLLRYGLPPLGVLMAVTAALAAWDLDEFSLQLRRYGDDPRVEALWHHHLRRVLLILGVAVAMGVFNLTIRLSLGFGLTVLLGALSFLGLAQAARLLRQR
jgi:hypothetical protein